MLLRDADIVGKKWLRKYLHRFQRMYGDLINWHSSILDSEPDEQMLTRKAEVNAVKSTKPTIPVVETFDFGDVRFRVEDFIVYDYGTCLVYLCQAVSGWDYMNGVHVLLFHRVTGNWYHHSAHRHQEIEDFERVIIRYM